MSYICRHHRLMAECTRCPVFEHPRLGVMSLNGPSPDYGEQIIGGPTRPPGALSMDFYHLMNAGLLASIIAVIASILYLILAPVA